MIETSRGPESPFISHRATGSVTIDELVQAIVCASEYESTIPELWDFGRAESLFALSRIHDLRRSHDRMWLDNLLRDTKPRKSAWFAVGGFNRAVLELFLDDAGIRMDRRVFGDMNGAFHWITSSGVTGTVKMAP